MDLFVERYGMRMEENELRGKIENPALKLAMDGLRASEQDGRPSKIANDYFLQELLKARLLCPVELETPPPVEDAPVKIEGKIKIFGLNAQDGRSFLMAFTDAEELKKWRDKEEEQIMVWSIARYANILLKQGCPHEGVVINPFGENIIVKREYLPKLLQRIRAAQKPLVVGEEEVITDYSGYPEGLIPALCAYLSQSGDVERAYMTEMTKEDEQDYLLIVDTKENPRYLFPCINNATEPYLKDKKMKIILYGTELADAVVAESTLIFAKKKK